MVGLFLPSMMSIRSTESLKELSRDNDGVSLAPVLFALASDARGPADALIETVLDKNFALEEGTGDSRSKSDFGDENESEYVSFMLDFLL